MSGKGKKIVPIIIAVAVLALIAVGVGAVLNLMNGSDVQVNMNDVVNTVRACLPYLIPMLVVIVAAIVVIIVARRFKQPGKYIARSESVIAIVLALLIGANAICFGPVYSMLNLVLTPAANVDDETYQESLDVLKQIAEEGMVLLKNDDHALPLSSDVTKLNVFGWGGVVNSLTTRNGVTDGMSLIDGLRACGYEVNQELIDFYTGYQTEVPHVGLDSQDWTVVEPTIKDYEATDVFNKAKAYSDTAIIAISRQGGENADLPMSITDTNTLDSGIYGEAVRYSSNPDDIDPSKHYLELSNREQAMVEKVAATFDNVIVVINACNSFELGWVDQYDSINGVILAYKPGDVGFQALGEILNGSVNPSAKLPDINLYDNLSASSANNFGYFVYDNMHDVVNAPDQQVWKQNLRASFVNVVEGIYVGYKFFETADVEGLLNYDEYVQYPFGYGLSYTTFDQKITDFQDDGNNITVSVEVTNTGDVAGKEVVEIYYTPPYYNGGIEKSAVNLIGFGKTGILQPGASETVTVSFTYENMASYDAKINRCYVLEHGDYEISLRSDSHTVLDTRSINVTSDVIYNEANAGKRSTDLIPAENQFDFATGEIEYLSRADGFANYKTALAAPTNYTLDKRYIDNFYCTATYNVDMEQDPNDVMPATGVSGNLKIQDVAGLEYDDPKWDQLLDQLTVGEMAPLISMRGYNTMALPSINMPGISETDGPAGVHSMFAEQNGTNFPASVMMAATRNRPLAERKGELVARQAKELGIVGWYAPAINIHRSAFGGRNVEYFSEDPVLTGVMGTGEVKTAVEGGLVVFMKHFALNEQETNRNDILLTWAQEQAIREIYLKPFEMAVEEGHCNAGMTSFAYIGNQYAGACAPLLNTVLRDEWGFHGMLITDYFADYGYMDADNIIRNGGDKMLSLTPVSELKDQTSPTAVSSMRRATHNILYTIANSNAVEGHTTALWETVFKCVTVAIILLLILAEVYIFTKGRKKHSASA